MTIHQEVTFNCEPQRLYDALTDAEQFAAFSDAPAEINAQEGGTFSCFDGMITGLFIEMKPGKRLVQAWRVANWDDGVYSVVTFDLAPVIPSGTRLILDHRGYPEAVRDHLVGGWPTKYWDPLKRYLEA